MSRDSSRSNLSQQDDVEILNLNYADDLEKEEQHRRLFEALLEAKTPSGEPTVTAAAREVLRAFYKQHIQADFHKPEADERVENEEVRMSDYDQLNNEIEALRSEITLVAERVVDVRVSMENRWQGLQGNDICSSHGSRALN